MYIDRKEVILKVEDQQLVVSMPYDVDVKDEIKALGGRWNPDNRTWSLGMKKLDELREILSNAAESLNWQISDYSAKSQAQITAEKEEYRDQALKNHVKVILDSLKSTPKGYLKMESWSGNVISLGLKYYVENNVFSALKEASLCTWFRNIINQGSRKASFGYRFNVLAHPAIFRVLGDLDTEYLIIDDITDPVEYDHGSLLHLTRERIAIIATKIDMSMWNSSYDPWRIGFYKEAIYCVLDADYIFSDSSTTIRFWKDYDSLKKLLENLHMEEHFRRWAKAQVESQKVVTRSRGRKASDWSHPGDNVISLVSQAYYRASFRELIGWTEDDVESYKARIENLKTAAAEAQIAKDRMNAKRLAHSEIEKLKMRELIELLDRNGVERPKKAKKAELFQIATESQIVCENLIGL